MRALGARALVALSLLWLCSGGAALVVVARVLVFLCSVVVACVPLLWLHPVRFC